MTQELLLDELMLIWDIQNLMIEKMQELIDYHMMLRVMLHVDIMILMTVRELLKTMVMEKLNIRKVQL